MKTLVIGATGTVGSQVVAGLLAKGETVRVMTRTPDKAKALGNVEIMQGDLTDPTTAKACFEGVDAVFMLNPVSMTETHEGLTGVELARALVALDSSGKDIRGFDFPPAFLLLPGVEGPGLPPEMKEGAVSIPLSHDVESLNGAVAASIALYEWRRRR